MANCTLVWFRNDLRMADNPALTHAARKNGTVLPVFIWAPEEESPWAPGAACRYWLHQSLELLSESLKKAGSPLIIRKGSSLGELKKIIQEWGADAVYWNRRYEPAIIERDRKIKEELQADGLVAQSFKANLLFEPQEIKNKQGQPYKVFTPYWKECLRQPDPEEPEITVRTLHPPSEKVSTLSLEALQLEPDIDWARGIEETWEFGEKGAWKRLESFLEDGIEDYKENRDKPAASGVSRLSPHLHFGEISPRQIWNAVWQKDGKLTKASLAYLRQLGWREFSYHLLYHFPHTAQEPLRPEFKNFPWAGDTKNLTAWQKGQTGIPLVDAGMRQLWTTGYMHNRVRMVVASFLVKNLLVPWQEGARWFWDTLVDADLANNTMGWQWTAGCGADAAPYFRIFNPVSQGNKFDPEGDYVRQWVPELENLSNKYLFEPWAAPPEELEQSGITLGKTYPMPIVSLSESRHRALEALEKMKQSS